MVRISILLLLLSTSLFAQKKSYDLKARDEGAKMVESEMGLVDHPKTLEYITKVGDRLVAQLESRAFDYRFFIVDMAEPNAFTLPGGYIYISRGLLALINDEAELAGVLGHEIIHAHDRHSYKQMKRSIFPGLLKLPGNLIGLANENVGALINAPIGAATGLSMAKYSRKHEYKADEGGLILAARAGYDPQALATALSNLNKDVEYLMGQKVTFNYFDDHPYTPDRIERINESIANITWKPQPHFAPGKAELYKQLSGIYLGQNPAQGVFKQSSFYHADLGFGINFPENWVSKNSPKYIAAGNKDGTATIVWGVLSEPHDPDDIANALITKMKEQYGITQYKSESTIIDGFKAHIFAIDQLTGGERINLFICWIKKGAITYQMLGTGLKTFEKSFEKTARSFHTLTDAERGKVSGIVLRVETSKNDETLKAFGSRSANALTDEFTAILNGVASDQPLPQQPLKIGRSEIYKPQ